LTRIVRISDNLQNENQYGGRKFNRC